MCDGNGISKNGRNMTSYVNITRKKFIIRLVFLNYLIDYSCTIAITGLWKILYRISMEFYISGKNYGILWKE